VNRRERRRAEAAERTFGQRLERDRLDTERQRFWAVTCKRIEQLMTTDGDHCSLCRARFQHNSRSYGGITGDGVIALVSDCCASKLDIKITSGLYTSRPYAELREQRNDGPDIELSQEQAEEVITAYQQHFAAIDEVTDRFARRAGIPAHIAEKTRLRCADNAWGNDDRIWFERNPTRSHRLRPLFPGESHNRHGGETLPNHELQILVRRVEPGWRVRTGFFPQS
jgi:hypothetical protein